MDENKKIESEGENAEKRSASGKAGADQGSIRASHVEREILEVEK